MCTVPQGKFTETEAVDDRYQAIQGKVLDLEHAASGIKMHNRADPLRDQVNPVISRD